MDRYQRVEKAKVVTPIAENEIRITSQGRMRSYISYAITLLQERGSDEIVFKAIGRAINKTVTVVELIKRRIVGLHQNTSIGSTEIIDTWEPLEEGLLPLETTRHVSMITITLSKNELNVSSTGYQPPIPADQVKAYNEAHYEDDSPISKGSGRGGRSGGRAGGDDSVNADQDGVFEYSSSRGRGRGRGKNFRGRGRGGYNSPQFDGQDEGYNQESPNHMRQFNRQQGAGGYNQEAPDRRRKVYNRARFDRTQVAAGGYDQEAPNRRGRGHNETQFDRQQVAAGDYNQEAPNRRRGGYAAGYHEAPAGGYARGRGGSQGGSFNEPNEG